MKYWLTLLLVLSPLAAKADSLTPKVQVRTALGILKNSGTEGGSSFMMGGINAALALFPLPVIALYGGYNFDLDIKSGSVPLKGWMAGTRWYFLGEGTQVTREFDSTSSTTRAGLSMYLAGEVAHREYYAENTDASGKPENINGSSVGLNVAVGVDLRLTDRLDLNVELNNTILTFAATDPRYRIAGGLLQIGLGLLF